MYNKRGAAPSTFGQLSLCFWTDRTCGSHSWFHCYSSRVILFIVYRPRHWIIPPQSSFLCFNHGQLFARKSIHPRMSL